MVKFSEIWWDAVRYWDAVRFGEIQWDLVEATINLDGGSGHNLEVAIIATTILATQWPKKRCQQPGQLGRGNNMDDISQGQRVKVQSRTLIAHSIIKLSEKHMYADVAVDKDNHQYKRTFSFRQRFFKSDNGLIKGIVDFNVFRLKNYEGLEQ